MEKLPENTPISSSNPLKATEDQAQLIARLQRELKIEASLEKVRSRTMEMRTSHELIKVATILYTELENIKNIKKGSVAFVLVNEAANTQTFWGAKTENGYLQEAQMPLLGDEILQSRYEAWKENTPIFHQLVSGKELQNHLEEVMPTVSSSDEVNRSKAFMPDPAYFYFFNFRQGFIQILSGEAVDVELQHTLTRFAKVFEQTYTRFLDLQKAEAQVREAQIEAALERVRSRTMSMQKSDELREVIAVIYEQIQNLGFPDWGCSIMICDEEEQVFKYWYSEVNQQLMDDYYKVPLTNQPVVQKQWNSWKSGIPLFTIELLGEEKDSYTYFLLNETDHKNLPEVVKEGWKEPENIFFAYSNMKYGLLEFVDIKSLNPENYPVYTRFATVFEQTYTRFLDLQKAEAQAREAKIEAALERVRARSMAMHNSEELSGVVFLLFDEIKPFGFAQSGCELILVDEKQEVLQFWNSNPIQNKITQSFNIPKSIHFFFQDQWEAWKNQEPRLTITLEGEEKKKFDQLIFSRTDFKHLPEDVKDFIRNHGIDVFSLVTMKHGLLEVVDKVPISEEMFTVLQRFGKVFDQTYTRFLDIQKAEAQAREAQIEAALERIRSRTMAMQRTFELNEVVGVIFEELNKMGFDALVCSIGIYDRETKGSDWWSFIAGGDLPGSYHFPYLEARWFREVYDAWVQKIPYHYIELHGEENDEYARLCFEKTDWVKLSDEIKNALIEVSSTGFKASYISMNCGMLEIVGDDRLTDDKIKLLQRFTKVIDLTYTRVDDLQKAEALAREATKQASLDRVRAEIASMRSTQDLERITPLVWQELTTLGVPFFRCGVFIVNEVKQIVHSYLSTPDGHSLAAMDLPFEINETTIQLVAHWQKNLVFKDHWDKEQFVNWMQSMVGHQQLQNQEQYQAATTPPESLYLHFIPFKQGMLYVGNIEELNAEEIDLVQSLAAAFSIAYTRYDDFRQLEEAKLRVEATLDELKLTQAQLIQSEKMASLGELTAGIAHEIQNPLNFVNNYSEVNVELIDDITDELEKGSIGEAKELLLDLLDNETKIHHHGKKAEAIVRGMLLHSRKNSGTKEPTNLNALADEYLRLSYQTMRRSEGRTSSDPAKYESFEAEYQTDFDPNLPQLEVAPSEFGRVLLNIINNAFQACAERSRSTVLEGKLPGIEGYKPVVKITTQNLENTIEIRITDNGNGIPEAIKDKIFQPFFTTKPTGQGTGLGLSLAYDIVKAHGGELRVESVEGEGTEFIIQLSM